MRQRILFTGKGRQHAIDGKVLMLQTDSRQLLVGMGDLFQGRRLCAGNQNQSRECRIREGFHCVSVLVLLFLQPHQRAEVRRSIRMCIEVPAPGARQLKHTDGVSGWCSIKDDMIIFFAQFMTGQQRGKFIKRRDLRGT